MLELVRLQYFREVAIAGTVTGAAARLYVAPSAVSRQLRSLEHELGTDLFTRDSRGMTLTAAGHVMFTYATENINLIDRLLGRLSTVNNEIDGTVTVASVEGGFTKLLPCVIESLTKSHPRIRVVARMLGSDFVVDAVTGGDADLGLVFGPRPTSLLRIASRPAPLCVAVHLDHPLRGHGSCTLQDLKGVGVAVPTSEFGVRREFDLACREADVALRVVYESNSLSFLLRLAETTDVAAVVGRSNVVDDARVGSLVTVPLAVRRLAEGEISLVRSATRSVGPAMSIVSDLLAMAINEPDHGRSSS